MEPGQRFKYSENTKAGLPKNRDSIPGMGKRFSSLPEHPNLLPSPPNSIFDRQLGISPNS